VNGAPVGGGVSDVKRLKVGDLKEFHARNYVPSEAALVIVGNVGRETLKPSLEKLFGGWRGPAPKKAVKAPLPPPYPGLRLMVVDRPGAVQTAVFAAQRFPARATQGFEAREVLGEIVGGLFTSRINMNLREKHAYTYGASARPVATRNWGALVVSSSVRTDATAPALVEIQRELGLARDPGPRRAAHARRCRPRKSRASPRARRQDGAHLARGRRGHSTLLAESRQATITPATRA
jgi:zinc protease